MNSKQWDTQSKMPSEWPVMSYWLKNWLSAFIVLLCEQISFLLILTDWKTRIIFKFWDRHGMYILSRPLTASIYFTWGAPYQLNLIFAITAKKWKVLFLHCWRQTSNGRLLISRCYTCWWLEETAKINRKLWLQIQGEPYDNLSWSDRRWNDRDFTFRRFS